MHLPSLGKKGGKARFPSNRMLVQSSDFIGEPRLARKPCDKSNAQMTEPSGNTAPIPKRKIFVERPSGVRAKNNTRQLA